MADQPRTRCMPSCTPTVLDGAGRSLWDRTLAAYDIQDMARRELLAQACAMLDRAEALAEEIANDGAVLHGRGDPPKAHPALKEELAARAFVVRTLRGLGLDPPEPKRIGRPGGRLAGWTGYK